MFLNFSKFRIWLPSIMAFLGLERYELVKNRTNTLKVESAKQYKKGMNEGKGIKTRYYTRNK